MTRRSGRTTRIIDQAIQDLFNNGSTLVLDHHRTEKMDERTFKIFLKRLHNEHQIVENHLIIDYDSLLVKLDYAPYSIWERNLRERVIYYEKY